MPKARICKQAGRTTLIEPTAVYCPKHMPPKRIPFANATRSNEVLYKTHRWRALRKKIIAETPYCVKCGSNSNLQVHHKIPPRGDEDLFYEEGNCVPVCKLCHRKLTAREINNRR